MQAACDTAFNYAHERKQFNTKIGEFQLIQAKVNKSFFYGQEMVVLKPSVVHMES